MITTALLGLALIAPAPTDSDIEPIDDAVILVLENTPEGAELCGAIATHRLAVDNLERLLGVDIAETFMAAGFALAEQKFVDGFGPAAAFTPEAKVAFREWIASCAL